LSDSRSRLLLRPNPAAKFTIKEKWPCGDGIEFFHPRAGEPVFRDLSDGRILEGNTLPGLRNAAIHLESGKKDKKTETDLPRFSR